jgi:transposase-like protein
MIRARADLGPAAVALEATYSVAEVAEHFGCSAWQVHQLVRLGRAHGARLHPTRGGLWPTFLPSRKCRRIPASAIARHLAHMERRSRAA